MFDRLISVLGARSPRACAPPPEPRALFARARVVPEVSCAAVDRSGTLWVAGVGGLLEPESGALLRALDPEGQAHDLTWVAAGPFVAAGGPGGLWVLGDSVLMPVPGIQGSSAGAATEDRVFVGVLEGDGRSAVRAAARHDAPWHRVTRLKGRAQAMVAVGSRVLVSAGGEVLALTASGPRVRVPGPEGRGPDWMAADQGRLLAAFEGEPREDPPHLRVLDLEAGTWGPALEARGWPGPWPGGLAVAGPDGVTPLEGDQLGERLPAFPEALEPALEGTLLPVGRDEVGRGLLVGPRAVLRAARKTWKPLFMAGRVPATAAGFRRTRSGALWVRDGAGALFHRSPVGSWTRVVLPAGWRASDVAMGCDGEALVFLAFEGDDPRGACWVAAPREEEQGGLVRRAPRVLPLAGRDPRDVGAVAGLGTRLYVGVGSELLRIQGDQVEAWGEAEGLPAGSRVLAAEPLFDDLWVLFEGEPGPRQFGQGAAESEPVARSGPEGRTTCLAGDDDSGQLWVGFEDGGKGGVASLSREGIWITQLRLPGRVKMVAAQGGTMLAATSKGLVLLEEGQRIRRIFTHQDGLDGLDCRAVGLVDDQVWLDCGQGVLRSDAQRWRPKPEAEAMRV